MRIPILVLVAGLIVALLVACVLFLLRRYFSRFQFSLRGFLGLVSIVATLFASTIGYRRNTMAQLTWIPVANDIVATCVDVAGTAPLTELHGKPLTPLEGRSLLPAFNDQPIERDGLFWEHEGNAAVRDGDWNEAQHVKTGSFSSTSRSTD
jgi:hypothetical protein